MTPTGPPLVTTYITGASITNANLSLTMASSTNNYVIAPAPHRAEIRTVHAEHPLGLQVVRYNRAGKWWLEWHADGPLTRPEWKQRQRQQVTFTEAYVIARAVRDFGGQVHLGLMGGKRFDAQLRAAV